MQLKKWQTQELIKILKAKRVKKAGSLLYHVIFENHFELNEISLSDPFWLIENMKESFTQKLDTKLADIATLLSCDTKKQWNEYNKTNK